MTKITTKFSTAVSFLKNKAESINELVQEKTQTQGRTHTSSTPSYESNGGTYAKRDQRTSTATKAQKITGLIAGLIFVGAAVAQTAPTLVNQSTALGGYGSASLVDTNSTSNSLSTVNTTNTSTATTTSTATSTVTTTNVNTNNNVNSGAVTYTNNNVNSGEVTYTNNNVASGEVTYNNVNSGTVNYNNTNNNTSTATNTNNNNNVSTSTNTNTNNNTNTSTSTNTNNNTVTSTNTNINNGTMNYNNTNTSTATNTNNNTNTSTATNTNTNNNTNTSTSTNTNTNNNTNTSTSTNTNNNTNTSTSSNVNTNNNTSTSTSTSNNNNVNQNVQTGDMTNRNINETTITQKVIQPPPTAIAPMMMSGGNQDLCTTGTSSAVQTQIFGVSTGGTVRDLNCERLKLSKTLFDMGMKVAAVATMCQDKRVWDAMMAAGTPCPYEGKIGEQAKAAWEANPKKVPPEPEKEVKDDTYQKVGFGALIGILVNKWFN